MTSNEHPEALDWVLERLTPTDTRAGVEVLELRWRDLADSFRREAELFAQVGEYFENNEETLEEVLPRLPDDLKVFVQRYQIGHSKSAEDKLDR